MRVKTRQHHRFPSPRRPGVTALSAGPLHPALVPDRLVGLVDPAVGAEHEEPVEPAGEPPVVGHRDDRAVERRQPLLQRLGRDQVEVVGRLVEQQQGRAGQLEQQDLQPGLLAAGQRLEASAPRRAPARSGPAPGTPARGPSRRGARRRATGCPAACGRPARGARGSGRTSPGRTRAPSRARPVCATGAIARSSTGRCSTSGSVPPAASSRRKCDLPDPLEPSTATRSPYQTSRSNGFISPVSSSPSQTTARLPVRPPRSRIVTSCSAGSPAAGRPPRTSAAGSPPPGSARPSRRCRRPSACTSAPAP